MVDGPQQEQSTSLGTIALGHSIAFRGNDIEMYRSNVAQVRELVARGQEIYPPAAFPTWSEPVPRSILRTSPTSELIGRLAPAEAVGVLTLLNESGALFQAFGQDSSATKLLLQTLGLPSRGWPTDAIEGITQFGEMLGSAAEVRDTIIRGEKPPTGSTNSETAKRRSWDKFHDAIEKDNMILGENTSTVIVQMIDELATDIIPKNPDMARNAEEVKARIESEKRGARLAKDLYLEARQLASHELPERVEATRPIGSTPLPPIMLEGK